MPSLTGLDTILDYIGAKNPLLASRREPLRELFAKSPEMSIQVADLDTAIGEFAERTSIANPNAFTQGFKGFAIHLEGRASGLERSTKIGFVNRLNGIVKKPDFISLTKEKGAPFSFVNSYGFERADIKDETELTR